MVCELERSFEQGARGDAHQVVVLGDDQEIACPETADQCGFDSPSHRRRLPDRLVGPGNRGDVCLRRPNTETLSALCESAEITAAGEQVADELTSGRLLLAEGKVVSSAFRCGRLAPHHPGGVEVEVDQRSKEHVMLGRLPPRLAAAGQCW